MVIKKDGSRERFERQKLIAGPAEGVREAAGQRGAFEAVADRVEATLQERPEKEMSTERDRARS